VLLLTGTCTVSVTVDAVNTAAVLPSRLKLQATP
jgi:hypothetical protein